ncbi:hypothetical protein BOSEA31B_13585 [Hyphomicrobiales bacterium]|nr:hypothetical protein BOSEA31B_13585 [Hyphomicrobiales bacterium]CAH1699356.1 hypothetical protein BOSEA1005_12409 [Hyphomicrobiales bacterium]CAI0343144.1 hypothetical protein BO1005MUT1_210209 [Hyphomicrobiales bacterium]
MTIWAARAVEPSRATVVKARKAVEDGGGRPAAMGYSFLDYLGGDRFVCRSIGQEAILP